MPRWFLAQLMAWPLDAIGTLTLVIALAAVAQAFYIRATYKLNEKTHALNEATLKLNKSIHRPVVFAYLRDGKEQPGIRVENSGNGIAWRGRVTVTALTSGQTTTYDFTRMLARSRYEYPIQGQPALNFDKLRDREIKVHVIYADAQQDGEAYEWESVFPLQPEWLRAPRTQVS